METTRVIRVHEKEGQRASSDFRPDSLIYIAQYGDQQ